MIKMLNKIRPFISLATVLAIITLSAYAPTISEAGVGHLGPYIISIVVVALNYIIDLSHRKL